MKILGIEEMDTYLAVDISGMVSRFHYLWLRDSSPDCRSPNGQKLHETNTLDPKILPNTIDCSDEAMTIEWNDGIRSVYPLNFLVNCRYDKIEPDSDQLVLWDKEIIHQIGSHDYDQVCNHPSQRLAWLQDIAKFGFALLSNVPTGEKKLFDVVGLFGFVRETNYGKLFEVRATKDASNLAYTPAPLSVHTDNPYRDPCPTLQLLHCLEQADEGGLTALADGFHAAARLQYESPQAYELLTTHDVSFHYESEDAILDNRDKIITVNSDGSIQKIRVNNRSIAALDLPFDLMLAFYDALSKFRGILEDEISQYRFRLRPGDLVLFDNERVLHGRIGQSVGARNNNQVHGDLGTWRSP